MLRRLKGLLTTIGIGSRLPGGTSLWPSSWLAGAGVDPRRDARMPTPAESFGLSSVNGAVGIIAGALASAEWTLSEELPRGGLRKITDGDVARCLSDLIFECKEALCIDAILSGNAYAVVRRNDRGGAFRLEWMPSWRVSVRVPDNGGPHSYLIGSDVSVGEPEESLRSRDVCHIRFRISGRHRLLGVSPLVSAAPSLGLVIAIRRAGSSLFRNLTLHSAILRHLKRLNDAQVQNIKIAFERAISVRDDELGAPIVLQEGMEIDQIDFGKAIDWQLAELSRLGVAEVSRLLGVPVSLLGEPGSVSYSSSVELSRQFTRMTLSPWAARMSSALANTLLSRDERLSGRFISVDLSPLTRGEGQELGELTSKLANSGIASPNELRSWLNLSPVAGGDELRAPVNTYPLGNWLSYEPPVINPAATDNTAQQGKELEELIHKAIDDVIAERLPPPTADAPEDPVVVDDPPASLLIDSAGRPLEWGQ